ncbi:hypothetical protein BJV74DRAFT_883226 [Russula compacta]|nr:hypothetical protein BJV74DRAFT_883226 [Russula compacta]
MITLSALLALVSSATAHLLTVINANPSTIWHVSAIFSQTLGPYEIAIAQSVPLFRLQSPPFISDQSDVQRIWKYRQILGDGDPLSGTVRSPPEMTRGYVYMPTHQAVPPATVVEWMLNRDGILNPFDHVCSLDRSGHNPSASNGTVTSYPVDHGPGCPSPLVGLEDLNGSPVWCSLAASTGTVQWPSYSVLDSDHTPIVSAANTSNPNDIPNFTSPSGGTGMLAVLNTTAPWAALVPCVLVGWLLVR